MNTLPRMRQCFRSLDGNDLWLHYEFTHFPGSFNDFICVPVLKVSPSPARRSSFWSPNHLQLMAKDKQWAKVLPHHQLFSCCAFPFFQKLIKLAISPDKNRTQCWNKTHREKRKKKLVLLLAIPPGFLLFSSFIFCVRVWLSAHHHFTFS